MKKLIYILAFFVFTSSCNTDTKTQIISVLEDKTENHFVAKPNQEAIIQRFDFENDIWKSATFRYGNITSLENNHQKQVQLKAEQALFGNEIKRKQEVKRFTATVKFMLKKSKDTTLYTSSSIWLPVAQEIKTLQGAASATATLYLYSDLRENTRWFSTYNSSDITRLKTDMESVVKLFLEKAKGIVPSKNLSVVVVYTPRNESEDQACNLLKKLYYKVFQQLGISITFTTDIL